jgi:hypothetical protein
MYIMALTEKRTQVYLTHAQHAALLRAARTRNVSLAEVVREAVDAYLTRKPARERGDDPLADLIGFVNGPGDLSERHDDYLYGPLESSGGRRGPRTRDQKKPRRRGETRGHRTPPR